MNLTYKYSIQDSEFSDRRQKLSEQLPDNSLFFVFSAQEKIRNNDCTYTFRQDSNFWYLTGFNEPDSCLLLTKINGKTSSHIFLRPKDPLMETWNGRRLGVEHAVQKLNIDNAYNISEIVEKSVAVTPNKSNKFNIFSNKNQDWNITEIQQIMQSYQSEELLDANIIIAEMRLFKSQDEARIIEQAGFISAMGHLKAMQQVRPNRFEYELESEIIHCFSQFGSRACSYNTIVAGGENGCILHYTENDMLLKDGDLVLIDAGCELHNYAGDITRTFPVNGKFSDEQKQIYQIVLNSMHKAIELLVPNSSIYEANIAVKTIMLEGLIELGIINQSLEQALEDNSIMSFYMHGLGHMLGLDVHDVGNLGKDRSRKLEAGMVLTVEPGIYLSPSLDIPEKYKGIAVRIEDNLLITADGNKNLTTAVPKEIDQIEAYMQQNNLFLKAKATPKTDI